jgi:hypothetical protein
MFDTGWVRRLLWNRIQKKFFFSFHVNSFIIHPRPYDRNNTELSEILKYLSDHCPNKDLFCNYCSKPKKQTFVIDFFLKVLPKYYVYVYLYLPKVKS